MTTQQDEPVDWSSPTWGSNPIHVASGGDLAGEQPDDDGGGDRE